MKKILSLLCLINISLLQAKPAKKIYVIDQVSAMINPGDVPTLGSKEEREKPPKTIVITQQEVVQRGFDGQKHTLADLVEENMLWQKAELMKMSLSDEDVERQLEKMGMTKEQEVSLSQQWNFANVSDFKQALKKMYVANMALSYDTEIGLTIPEEDIKAYYDQHPVERPAQFEVQTSSITGESDLDQAQLAKRTDLEWSEVVTIDEGQITSQNDYLTKLQPGQIHVQPVAGGLDLIKLVKVTPRHLEPLIERQAEISAKLRQERYPKALGDVKKELHRLLHVHYPKQLQVYSLD
jgi:hypothetical protein